MNNPITARLTIFSLLIVLAGCVTSLKPETYKVSSLSSTIDQYTDSLIAHYGTRLDSDSTLRVNVAMLAQQLDTLAFHAGHIKCRRVQDVIQPYIGDCRTIYLLSLNPNLNADAFARILSSLNTNRGKMQALIRKQPK